MSLLTFLNVFLKLRQFGLELVQRTPTPDRDAGVIDVHALQLLDVPSVDQDAIEVPILNLEA